MKETLHQGVCTHSVLYRTGEGREHPNLKALSAEYLQSEGVNSMPNYAEQDDLATYSLDNCFMCNYSEQDAKMTYDLAKHFKQIHEDQPFWKRLLFEMKCFFTTLKIKIRYFITRLK